MKNFKNKRTLQIVLVVLIALITLGIGYASISVINLIINGNATVSGNDSNFIVHFTANGRHKYKCRRVSSNTSI